MKFSLLSPHLAAPLVGGGLILSSLGSVCAEDPLPPLQFPDACGVQLKTHNFTPKILDQTYDLGFRAARRGIYWNSVEKEKGTYDFSDYDAMFELAKKKNMRLVVALFSSNKLYEEPKGGVVTEPGRKGFAQFAAAAAARYKGYPIIWEIWNEPNVRTFWRKDGKHNTPEFADEYTALVKEVMPAMLKADPKAFVVAGSVSNYWEPSYQWTQYCFERGILDTGIRGWSVHPYGVKTPEEFAIGHARTRELLKKFGKENFPMLNTERGFAVKENQEGWSGGSKEMALEYQGWQFVRQFMVDQLEGIHLTIWYEWDGDKFGMADDNGSRPVYQAAKTMFEQLDGYRIAERLKSDSELDYVVLMKNASGAQKLVAWTAPPPASGPDEAVEHTAKIAVTAPASFSGALDVVAINGAAGKAPAQGGALELVLSGAPQYVTVPAGMTFGAVKAGPPTENALRQKAEAKKVTAAPQSAGRDLKLFEPGTAWEFKKNTGDGSFRLSANDGQETGIIAYNFANSKTDNTPYVLATVELKGVTGGQALSLQALSGVAQQITLRATDSTGQTHQFKSRLKGSGQWETVTMPLDKKLEHWGGAKDGTIHFPLTALAISVPLPNEHAVTGEVEFANIKLVP